ncbi:hypothetical protein ACS5NO_28335 [Larkinella sp. GY13]|uniref:hypothetical protein n=1 Tax=Larkinella sp. GY13 TaxID=3453720 RepID=UPI003EE9DA0A
MTVFDYLLSVACGLGVLLGFYVAYLLWHRTGPDRLAHQLLALTVVCVSLRVSKPLLVLYVDLPPFAEFIGLAGSLVAVPVFFLFLKIRLANQNRLRPGYGWHALPAGLYVVWISSVLR